MKRAGITVARVLGLAIPTYHASFPFLGGREAKTTVVWRIDWPRVRVAALFVVFWSLLLAYAAWRG